MLSCTIFHYILYIECETYKQQYLHHENLSCTYLDHYHRALDWLSAREKENQSLYADLKIIKQQQREQIIQHHIDKIKLANTHTKSSSSSNNLKPDIKYQEILDALHHERLINADLSSAIRVAHDCTDRLRSSFNDLLSKHLYITNVLLNKDEQQ